MGILLEQSTMLLGETRPASDADVIPLLVVVQSTLHMGALSLSVRNRKNEPQTKFSKA